MQQTVLPHLTSWMMAKKHPVVTYHLHPQYIVQMGYAIALIIYNAEM